ncbi:MAG: hypothetical protein AAFO69_07450 [Bacteroidota bacterium]
MKNLILVVVISLVLIACGVSGASQSEYYRFAKQVTPSGRYAIYDYARHGPMAFSSDISGVELFEINKGFREGGGINIKGSISEWQSNDTLLIYDSKSDLKQPKDTLPIKTEFKKLGDFIIKTVHYKFNSGGREIYKFDSVSMTNDSIYIQTIRRDNERKMLRFPLGGTTIKATKDSIIHISVNTRLKKSMNFIHKNSDGTFTSGLPSVGTTWYDLTPTKLIEAQSLNERKVFWEILK